DRSQPACLAHRGDQARRIASSSHRRLDDGVRELQAFRQLGRNRHRSSPRQNVLSELLGQSGKRRSGSSAGFGGAVRTPFITVASRTEYPLTPSSSMTPCSPKAATARLYVSSLTRLLRSTSIDRSYATCSSGAISAGWRPSAMASAISRRSPACTAIG